MLQIRGIQLVPSKQFVFQSGLFQVLQLAGGFCLLLPWSFCTCVIQVSHFSRSSISVSRDTIFTTIICWYELSRQNIHHQMLWQGAAGCLGKGGNSKKMPPPQNAREKNKVASRFMPTLQWNLLFFSKMYQWFNKKQQEY